MNMMMVLVILVRRRRGGAATNTTAVMTIVVVVVVVVVVVYSCCGGRHRGRRRFAFRIGSSRCFTRPCECACSFGASLQTGPGEFWIREEHGNLRDQGSSPLFALSPINPNDRFSFVSWVPLQDQSGDTGAHIFWPWNPHNGPIQIFETLSFWLLPLPFLSSPSGPVFLFPSPTANRTWERVWWPMVWPICFHLVSDVCKLTRLSLSVSWHGWFTWENRVAPIWKMGDRNQWVKE